MTGRPIVGNFKSPFTNASKFIAHTLQPILEKSGNFIKNSFELIRILDEVEINKDFPVVLITGDVSEMYPSIPLNEIFDLG